jgi:TatD DNase family protein
LEKTKQLIKERDGDFKRKTRMADSHCHLYAIDAADIRSAVASGVEIMVTNGVDTKSNMETLSMIDNRNVYGTIGVHPEFASKLDEDEIEFNKRMIMDNSKTIVGVGEVGLDYSVASDDRGRNSQKRVFIEMLDCAVKINKPVSVHSRMALKDVFSVLDSYHDLKVHIHFFEGNAEQAREAERRGYMISVPYLSSAARVEAVKAIGVDMIMAETDSPTAGAKPSEIYRTIEFIAKIKGIGTDISAETTFNNTKRLFNIGVEKFMRQGL